MIAPMMGGTLIMIDPSYPVYASTVIFTLSGICVMLIEEPPKGSGEDKGRRRAAIVH
jgi:hypothetical protein